MDGTKDAYQGQAYQQADRNSYQFINDSPCNSDNDGDDFADQHREISPGNSLFNGCDPNHKNDRERNLNVDDMDPFSYTPVGLNYAKVHVSNQGGTQVCWMHVE